MKVASKHQKNGAALILSLSMLLLLLLFLGGILSVAITRRERIQKELSRDLAEIEARSLLLNLKDEVLTQVRNTGGFLLNAWTPQLPQTLLRDKDSSPVPFFQRRISWSGTPSGFVHPEMPANTGTLADQSFLQNLAYRTVASFSLEGLWVPREAGSGQVRAQTPWAISVPISVAQVPLSAFTFYSSALQSVVNSTHNHLGRVYTQGDLIVAAPLEATAPVSTAGTLYSTPNGVLLIQKGDRSETRAFGGTSASETFHTQGCGWAFTRDANPAILARPVTTAELFARDPLPSTSKENQRLKPLCNLQIQHNVDSSGADIYALTGITNFVAAADPIKMLHRTDEALEIDFATWFPEGIWPTKVWIETTQPDITFVRIKNAQRLRGDLSLATRLHIQVVGSFNTEPPVKKASLMTMGRVLSVP